ncbi:MULTISPECIES: PIG-L deacetylase family protein [unclassified Tolypothrix]|uniref:PIG-L deacetylase family protein n=1 Tax=unclassified Tolypothrix TaxID=2649714 RepID=UPI0005EAAC70|nr:MULTISPECIES: PIG-L deacetylase family protein [unclassified Tolypothrix]BAY90313.1 LmbE-like protein [Microchaete diplosiphon NIES-3275]EKE98874.1 putative N-acetylglucosaminyl phosphatidylinositol deacetylase [Tolypothrix sp. PCC 7601]MBE9087508.1 PIG-L family deacetylase [Tolypothrix sp. LEGE 11397]UYD24496.1 PIG-L family deacetylase [Tolypothrix sp. PCC 7712]UYD33273.1 PIG-L family deacetylase [Tolypothrix sp. PCC 7601]
MKNNVLVIAPHADDEVLGCGGTIARHVDHGDEVHAVIVTCGDPDIYPAEVQLRLRQELKASHDILGISSVSFLDFLAPKLDIYPGYKLADAIGTAIRLLQPNIIYLPHRGDIHADHRLVYQATLVASRPINGCSVREIFCYETLSETEWAPPSGDEAFIPTVFVDITDYLEHKLKAMTCYQSQIKEPPHPRSLDAIAALAKLRGATVSLGAAEAFMLVRQIR